MELKTCEYCGTEYDASQGRCPICGRPAAASAPRQSDRSNSGKGGARLASRSGKKKGTKGSQHDRIPRWMWALVCVILGLAVLIGALYFFYIMGYFGKKSTNEAFQPVQTEQQPQTQEPEETPLEPEPAEEQPVIASGTACTSLTLSQSEVTLDEQGGRIFLTAVAQPMDCTDEIVFESSDESVALVDSVGMVTAVAPGEADIVVTCGSIVKTCHIICEFDAAEPEPEPEPEPAGPAADGSDASLSSVDFTLFHPGEQTTLIVRDAPAGASVTYVSSDTSVVTVTNAGLVTAVGSGTATITVTVNETKLKCIARCNLGDSTENNGGTAEVTGPCTISHSDVSLFSSGERFTISLTDANGNTVKGLNWYTSDGSVCSVDGSGVVTATGKGTATVSTTCGGQTYSCIVRCNFG